jgi:hypothetical protein
MYRLEPDRSTSHLCPGVSSTVGLGTTHGGDDGQDRLYRVGPGLADHVGNVILLTAVIEFGLSEAIPGLKNYLDYTRKVPWTDTDEQVGALQRELL